MEVYKLTRYDCAWLSGGLLQPLFTCPGYSSLTQAISYFYYHCIQAFCEPVGKDF